MRGYRSVKMDLKFVGCTRENWMQLDEAKVHSQASVHTVMMLRI
jgi:hypothetical protein